MRLDYDNALKKLFKFSIIINIIGNLIVNIHLSGAMFYFNLLIGITFLQIVRMPKKWHAEYILYSACQVIFTVIGLTLLFH
jgi:hypothetical protein